MMKRRAGTKLVTAIVFLALSLSCGADPSAPGSAEQNAPVEEDPYFRQKTDDGWIVSLYPEYTAGHNTEAPWSLFLYYSWTGKDESLPLELIVEGGNRQESTGAVSEFDFFPKTKVTGDRGYRETFLVFHSEQWKRLPSKISVKTKGSADTDLVVSDLKLERRTPGSGPLIADPGTMMYYPQSCWRNPEYEVFIHNLYPSILCLVSERFDVQSAFLKRLAFFVEKSGFAGRLAGDEEIAGLRDWFAHDYRAEDLAAFYNLAREQNFPLNDRELILRDLLIKDGIINDEGTRYTEGKGALLGFSLESGSRLPVYYVHETVHGLEFTMRELQKVFLDFFNALSAEEQTLLQDAFLYRGYNVVEDRQLLASEAASYLLQQRPEETDRYIWDYIMPWYVAYHKNTAGGDSEENYSDDVTRFLDANPGIFGRRCVDLQKEFRAITGLSVENFYDLLPKDRSL